MSRTIFRFTVPVAAEHVDVAVKEGPIVGDVLWVKSREHGTVDFWAIVDPDLDGVEGLPPRRRFTVTGTGRYVPDKARYCGSTTDGTDSLLVWHLWEICAHDYDPTGQAPAWCEICRAAS